MDRPDREDGTSGRRLDSPKLLPSEHDREGYVWATGESLAVPVPRGKIAQARIWFDKRIDAWVSAAGLSESGDGVNVLSASEEDVQRRLDALTEALRKRIGVVEIMVEPDEDDQLIFETLNARGEALLASDLVKNTLFRLAETQNADVRALHRKFWRDLGDGIMDRRRPQPAESRGFAWTCCSPSG